MLYCRVFYAYANWQQLMDKLDSKPISAFILTGTPTFTTYDDIRDVVLKMGDLKGFLVKTLMPYANKLKPCLDKRGGGTQNMAR